MINGPSLSNILHAYVVVGKHTYEVPSVLGAVDICYRITSVLQEDFSFICNHVWEFLGNQIYSSEHSGIYGITNLIQSLGVL